LEGKWPSDTKNPKAAKVKCGDSHIIQLVSVNKVVRHDKHNVLHLPTNLELSSDYDIVQKKVRKGNGKVKKPCPTAVANYTHTHTHMQYGELDLRDQLQEYYVLENLPESGGGLYLLS
jgi:hypothetical protein